MEIAVGGQFPPSDVFPDFDLQMHSGVLRNINRLDRMEAAPAIDSLHSH
jgi:hypothetical protein